jgi:hypothetical protein
LLGVLGFVVQNIIVDAFGFPHHVKQVVGVAGGMRVILGVGIRVVQAVHNTIRPGAKEGGTLENEGKHIKYLLPGWTHGKHLMSCIPVQEKGLGK